MSRYITTRGRSASRYPYDNRYNSQSLDVRGQSPSFEETIVRRPTGQLVERSRSRSVDRVVRRTSSKVVVRRRSVSRDTIPRPPRPPMVPDRSPSRSVSGSDSENDSRSRSRSNSRSPNRSRSRSRSGSRRCHSRRHRRRRDRGVQKISKTTVTKYAVPNSHRRPGNIIFIRVSVRDICPETLDHFRYPWEWDTVC
jgi:hypothetical protein